MTALLVAVCLTLLPAGPGALEERPVCLAQVKVKKVRIHFEGTKLVQVVKWITKKTGKNFIIEDSLRDRRITILSGTPVTVDEAYDAFLAALEAEGLRVETLGKFLRITRGKRRRLSSPAAVIAMGDCPIPAGITKVNETTYTIVRSEAENWFENPSCLMKQARIVPYFKDDKPAGSKLFAIRPGTLYVELGFRNGDVVQKLNGIPLTNLDSALQAYAGLKDAKTVTINILRRGKPIELKYKIE